MTTDEAIRKLLKTLVIKRQEILEELAVQGHCCDCKYCDFEDETDEDAEIKLQKELEKIDADIARYSALKLSEEICNE